MVMIIFLRVRGEENHDLHAAEMGGAYLNEKDLGAIVMLDGEDMHAILGVVI